VNYSEVRVIAISGSLREGSYTTMAVQTALRGVESVGATGQLLDLRDYTLPLVTGHHQELAAYPDVARLREQVQQSDGVILGTPEYHSSVSGVLKNALDLMGFEEFEGKMIGLVGVSAGSMGAIDAVNALRTIGRALHAWVVPEQAVISHAPTQFDSDGRLVRADLNQRVMEVGRQVARYAYLLRADHVRDFLQQWERAPQNPGAEDQ
jgi:NAD(P)H-dependent FMN reductase